MLIKKKPSRVNASRKAARPTRRAIRANEEIEEEVAVAPEATDLLFEAEDVAELVAEVTGDEVAVEVAEDEVVFTVGEDEFTVTPEGDEELVESATRKASRRSSSVKASRKVVRRR